MNPFLKKALILGIFISTESGAGLWAQEPLSSQDAELNNRGVKAAQAGRFEEGVALLQKALLLDSADSLIQKNLSQILTDWGSWFYQHGERVQAQKRLEEALRHDPENTSALLLLGNLLYLNQGDLSRVTDLWKRALEGMAAPRRAALLERIFQAQRDLAVERGFAGLETEHFRIRFEQPEVHPGAASLGALLEREYDRLARALEVEPSPIGVIVYGPGTFHRVIGRKDWALGLYDGRIRLRVEDAGTERSGPILAHELAHAFLAQTYGPRIPIWVHEGFAQHSEGEPLLTDPQRARMEGIRSRTSWVPLNWLDRRFEQPSSREDLERAYLQARWMVNSLIQRHGMERFRRFLERLSAGERVEPAFNRSFAPLSWSRVERGILE